MSKDVAGGEMLEYADVKNGGRDIVSVDIIEWWG
jgi:hypothetical protein